MGRVRSVLVVEDNADNRLIMEIALGLTAALACQFVGTGVEAIERVRERDYEIVLLDPGLPDVGDREIMRAIIDREPPPTVIIVTADARASSAARYKAMGARAVILKPFNPLTFARDVLEFAG